MADVFELRSELDPWRVRLWSLIDETPWLDWLLLTKRPQNIEKKVPWKNDWPENVWLGTTVENQKYADERLPILLKFPAKRRFLLMRTAAWPVDLGAWTDRRPKRLHPIDWVIAGGESGANSRAMLPGWAKTLRDQCQQADIPFHFKQWGHWAPVAAPKNENPLRADFGMRFWAWKFLWNLKAKKSPVAAWTGLLGTDCRQQYE